MLFKTTNRLFRGIYQYKIVLVVPGAGLFRGGDSSTILKSLKKIADNFNAQPRFNSIKTKDELDYAFKLQAQLTKLSNFELRVESPFISVYSNSETDINSLAKLGPDKVKYISKPPADNVLETGVILMPRTEYEFRVTMGKTTQNYESFISWADSNKNVKLTRSCIRDLSKDRSWGGTYFYITGNNNLLMARMHLGSSINKIERIVKA